MVKKTAYAPDSGLQVRGTAGSLEVRIHGVMRPCARPSAVATSSSSRPRERAGAAYPEGGAAGKRLGGSVLSIQAMTAKLRYSQRSRP